MFLLRNKLEVEKKITNASLESVELNEMNIFFLLLPLFFCQFEFATPSRHELLPMGLVPPKKLKAG